VLEPYDRKLSRTVLRGVGSRKAPRLPGIKSRTTTIQRNWQKWSGIVGVSRVWTGFPSTVILFKEMNCCICANLNKLAPGGCSFSCVLRGCIK